MGANPLMRTVTLASANQAYNLFTLLQALNTPPPIQYKECSKLQIQLDKDAGSANLFIGNQELANSSVDYGVSLFATQAHGIEEAGKNTINIDQYWLLSDTDATKVHIVVHVT